MTNLLAPNLKRLLKNRAFQIAAAVVAAIGLFEIIMMYRESVIEMETAYFDSGLFSFAAIGVFALAAVVPLFVGCEYSDGTIRNKVVVGHRRASVYVMWDIIFFHGSVVHRHPIRKISCILPSPCQWWCFRWRPWC